MVTPPNEPPVSGTSTKKRTKYSIANSVGVVDLPNSGKENVVALDWFMTCSSSGAAPWFPVLRRGFLLCWFSKKKSSPREAPLALPSVKLILSVHEKSKTKK
jgi:hypothetical protein